MERIPLLLSTTDLLPSIICRRKSQKLPNIEKNGPTFFLPLPASPSFPPDSLVFQLQCLDEKFSRQISREKHSREGIFYLAYLGNCKCLNISEVYNARKEGQLGLSVFFFSFLNFHHRRITEIFLQSKINDVQEGWFSQQTVSVTEVVGRSEECGLWESPHSF